MAVNNSFEKSAVVFLTNVLEDFKVNFALSKIASVRIDDKFRNSAFAVGQSIDIIRQPRMQSSKGVQVEGMSITETKMPFELDDFYNVEIEATVTELMLDTTTDRYNQLIRNASTTLIDRIERFMLEQAVTSTHYAVGATNAFATDLTHFNRAQRLMQSLGMSVPGDEAFCLVSQANYEALQGGLLAANNFYQSQNEDLIRRGAVGKLNNFTIFPSNNVAAHEAGAPGAGSITTTAVAGNGATSLSLTGLATSTVVFKAGDIIQVEGVSSMNFIDSDGGKGGNKNVKSTGIPMTFRVTADVTSDGSGNASVPIFPSIVTEGPTTNVSRAIPFGATITVYGDHDVNLFINPRSMLIAIPRIMELNNGPTHVQVTDPDTGITFSMLKQDDAKSMQRLIRMSALVGGRFDDNRAIRFLTKTDRIAA